MTETWDTYRRLFPVTRRWIYFNHAATAPYSILTARAMERYIRDLEADGGLGYAKWEGVREEVRRRAAVLLRCRPEEVALVGNTSEGANIVARGLSFGAGDNVVIPEREFPANVYPWLNLERRGVEVRVVPLQEGRLDAEAFLDRVNGRTRLAALSSAAFHNGHRPVLERIGAALAERGVPLYVDAIQTLGAFPLDVHRCRVSFLAADGHKWLLGPEGAGIFFCARERLEALDPPFASWMSVKEWGNYDRLVLEFAEGARRFECGTPHYAALSGLHRSLGLLIEIGVERIAERVLALTRRAGEGLLGKGYRLLTPWVEGERSGIVTFAHPDHTPEALLARLAAARVVATRRGGGVRISPHFYNTEDEVDRFLEALP